MIGIPRHIHMVWIGDEMPKWAQSCIDQCRRVNPGYDLIVHTDRPEMLRTPEWDAIIGDAAPNYLSDLYRYAILYQHGGWYIDLDTWCLRSVASLEAAICADGDRVVVAEFPGKWQAFQSTPLACCAGHPAMLRLIEGCRTTERTEYSSWGPILISRLLKNDPTGVDVIPRWMHSPADKGKAFATVENIRRNPRFARYIGQDESPYLIHLFADRNAEFGWDREPESRGQSNGKRALLLAHTPKKQPDGDPISAARDAFEAMGYRVDQVTPGRHSWRDIERVGIPDICVAWNGTRAGEKEAISNLRRMGIPVYVTEYGFFDRAALLSSTTFQMDIAGFLHTASWAEGPYERTDDGAERLARWVPEVARQGRRDGYVLVIGQTAGDSQMIGAEIDLPLQLEKLVARSGIKDVKFRPHPGDREYERRARRGRVYLPKCEAATLDEALSGARYVITINSNSIVRAVSLGVPCMAFGPSTSISAGVALHTSTKTLTEVASVMDAGWHPSDEAAAAYLQTLACHNYTPAEVADPAFWEVRV